MGWFSRDDNEDNSQQMLIDEQYKQNAAELEAKRANLASERLGIIKAQSGQVWSPTRSKGVSSPKVNRRGGSSVLLK